jgi:hypothetical protein
MRFEPSAVGVLEEVVAGARRRVDIRAQEIRL